MNSFILLLLLLFVYTFTIPSLVTGKILGYGETCKPRATPPSRKVIHEKTIAPIDGVSTFEGKRRRIQQNDCHKKSCQREKQQLQTHLRNNQDNNFNAINRPSSFPSSPPLVFSRFYFGNDPWNNVFRNMISAPDSTKLVQSSSANQRRKSGENRGYKYSLKGILRKDDKNIVRRRRSVEKTSAVFDLLDQPEIKLKSYSPGGNINTNTKEVLSVIPVNKLLKGNQHFGQANGRTVVNRRLITKDKQNHSSERSKKTNRDSEKLDEAGFIGHEDDGEQIAIDMSIDTRQTTSNSSAENYISFGGTPNDKPMSFIPKEWINMNLMSFAKLLKTNGINDSHEKNGNRKQKANEQEKNAQSTEDISNDETNRMVVDLSEKNTNNEGVEFIPSSNAITDSAISTMHVPSPGDLGNKEEWYIDESVNENCVCLYTKTRVKINCTITLGKNGTIHLIWKTLHLRTSERMVRVKALVKDELNRLLMNNMELLFKDFLKTSSLSMPVQCKCYWTWLRNLIQLGHNSCRIFSQKFQSLQNSAIHSSHNNTVKHEKFETILKLSGDVSRERKSLKSEMVNFRNIVIPEIHGHANDAVKRNEYLVKTFLKYGIAHISAVFRSESKTEKETTTAFTFYPFSKPKYVSEHHYSKLHSFHREKSTSNMLANKSSNEDDTTESDIIFCQDSFKAKFLNYKMPELSLPQISNGESMNTHNITYLLKILKNTGRTTATLPTLDFQFPPTLFQLINFNASKGPQMKKRDSEHSPGNIKWSGMKNPNLEVNGLSANQKFQTRTTTVNNIAASENEVTSNFQLLHDTEDDGNKMRKILLNGKSSGVKSFMSTETKRQAKYYDSTGMAIAFDAKPGNVGRRKSFVKTMSNMLGGGLVLSTPKNSKDEEKPIQFGSKMVTATAVINSLRKSNENPLQGTLEMYKYPYTNVTSNPTNPNIRFKRSSEDVTTTIEKTERFHIKNSFREAFQGQKGKGLTLAPIKMVEHESKTPLPLEKMDEFTAVLSSPPPQGEFTEIEDADDTSGKKIVLFDLEEKHFPSEKPAYSAGFTTLSDRDTIEDENVSVKVTSFGRSSDPGTTTTFQEFRNEVVETSDDITITTTTTTIKPETAEMSKTTPGDEPMNEINMLYSTEFYSEALTSLITQSTTVPTSSYISTVWHSEDAVTTETLGNYETTVQMSTPPLPQGDDEKVTSKETTTSDISKTDMMNFNTPSSVLTTDSGDTNNELNDPQRTPFMSTTAETSQDLGTPSITTITSSNVAGGTDEQSSINPAITTDIEELSSPFPTISVNSESPMNDQVGDGAAIEDEFCDKENGLECSEERKCKCREGKYFNSEKQKCMSLVGERCVKMGSQDNTNNGSGECPLNSECKNNGEAALGKHEGRSICKCLKGFSPTKDMMKCLPGLKTLCSPSSSQCHPDFDCGEINRKSRCVCKTNQTLGLAYALESKYLMEENDDNDAVGGDDVECLLNYGSDCDPLHDKCNNFRFLKCSNQTKKCECGDKENQLYYEIPRECVARVGTFCSLRTNKAENGKSMKIDEKDFKTPSCIANSTCVPISEGANGNETGSHQKRQRSTSESGTCQCNSEKYDPHWAGYCIPRNGMNSIHNFDRLCLKIILITFVSITFIFNLSYNYL